MTSIGHLPDGSRGVDCNAPISRSAAALFYSKGFNFAVRYVRRGQANSYDLTTGEVAAILGGGLGLMIVQHVAAPGWHPDAALGTQYGTTAADECKRVGIPAGVTVWCDLEGIASAASTGDVIDYCNEWYEAVNGAGFSPGLYLGDSCILTPSFLYHALKFAAFWSAYNLNADAVPAVRGVCMRQKVAKPADLIPGFTNQNMDVDVISADALGGSPFVLLP